MTEQEFLTSEDPEAMLGWLTGQRVTRPLTPVAIHPSDRKLRLFGAACCRATPPQGDQWDEFLQATDQIEQAADVQPYAPGALANQYFHPDWDAATLAGWAARGVPEAAAFLREIVGNPFRPVVVTDSDWIAEHERLRPGVQTPRCPVVLKQWLTPDALALAQSLYDCRDWSGLPALADMLEEAGCLDEAILLHLRGREKCPKCRGQGFIGTPGSVWGPTMPCREVAEPDWPTGTGCDGSGSIPLRGPHVRGCHVVDCLLGKS